ncbi:MAG: immunoglobulin domain-containing protein [Verrucomicrobiota bacterium]
MDPSFNPGASARVYSLAVQADGKILVGGDFTTLGGQSRNRIGRLNADGTLDASFNPGANNGVSSLVVQADGKILLGGGFTTLGGENRNRIGRLNADGMLDPSFNPGANDWVYSLAVQADGKILLGGDFTTLGGQSRNNIGRLNNTDPVTQSLTYDGSTLTWTRGGSSPEVWRTTFEHSANATDWTSLGAGTRIAGGWQLTGLSLLPNGIMRARGYVTGGFCNGSGWFVETMIATGAPVIFSQPASRTNNTGTSATFSVLAGGTPPLSYQWWKEEVALAGETESSLSLTNLQGSDAGNYMVVITNAYGAVTSAVAVLTVNLAPLDPSFNPGAGGGNYPSVNSLALQADGEILVGGTFTTLGGQPRNRIGRLKADGTLDASFNPGASGYILGFVWVDSLALQADGKILVGGLFTTLGEQSRNNIGRLHADGTLDSSFNPGAGETNSSVSSLVVQADGKILVGGGFTTLGGQSRNRIGRLNADGTLDTGFNPGANYIVNSVVLQADGKILVGGGFATLGGQSRNSIGRLNADGTLDTSFNPGANYWVYSLAVQADGKILVGGYFWTLGGQSRESIGRLNADGTVDPSLNTGASDWFLDLGWLFLDGSLDWGISLAVQVDGKILVGGAFQTLGGQSRNSIGRLNNNPATQSLTFEGSTITWTRGGSSPEVWRTTFEHSANSGDWTNLGVGTRIAGGWQLTGLLLPPGGTIRARGYVTGSGQGSGWFVETVLTPLSIPLAIMRRDLSFANGQFGFNFIGWAGQAVIIEASPNLQTWTPMQTNTLGASPVYFSDPESTALSNRFYRLRLGP